MSSIYTSPSEGSDTGEISYVSELLVGQLFVFVLSQDRELD